MEHHQISEKTKTFLQLILGTGEKWILEEVNKIFNDSTDEEDFIEEMNLYLARLELKIKNIKEQFGKIYPGSV